MAEERGYYQLEEQPEFKEQVERLLNSEEVRAEGSQFESLLLAMLNNTKAAYQKAGSVADEVGKPGGAASLDESGKVPASQLPDLSGQYEALYPMIIVESSTDADTLTTPGTYGGAAALLVNGPVDNGQFLMVVRQATSDSYIWQELYSWTNAAAFSKFSRTKSGGSSWTAWVEDFTPVADYYGLEAEIDIDTLTDDLMLVSNVHSKNCPVAGSFVLIQQFFYSRVANSNLRIQIAYGMSGGTSAPSSAYGMAIRRYSNSAWGEWEEIYTTRNKPTAADVGAIPTSEKGAPNGVATLDSSGRVPSGQLPSYVDDVQEYASMSAFPPTGEDGIIYIAEDTNLTYRWSGTKYVEISPSLALGETASTAYRGDRGKAAYDHSQITSGNPHGTTAADVGADPAGTAAGVQANLTAHINNKSNPHGVTAGQTGALPLSGGTMAGSLKAMSSPAVGTAQVRNIYAGTSDMTAGSSSLATGTIYLVYE